MTNPSPNPPPEPSNRRSFSARVLRIARHPATLVIGVSVVAIAAVGYAGIRYFVYTRLMPLVESQLSKIVKKPVYLGEVESLSWTLNRIRIGASSIPETPENRDRVDIKEIEISFNPFPVLFGQPLPIEATVIDPNAYIDQDATGQWIEYELPEGDGGELPIDLDIHVNVRDGDIALRPYRTTTSIPIQAEGRFRYLDADEKLIGYDVDATLLSSKVNAEGETNIDTGKSEVALVVEKLALAQLLAIIPNSPVKLKSGQLNADLNVSLPTLTELDNLNRTRGQGNLNLSQIEANIASIKEPVRATLDLNLQGQKLFIEQAQASIGRVVAAQIAGDIDWERGYNLNIKTNQVNIANLLRTLSVKLPVRVGGEAQANLQLTGLVDKPILTGSLNSTRPLQIDKTQLRQVRTNFQADLNKIVVQRLQIQPAAGGQIIGSGRVETKLEQALENNKPLDFTKMPLAFNFRAQLPTEEVVAPYYQFPTDVTIGTLTAQGQVVAR
ncbi:MAG: DUF748 domain-containing protein [Hydrococcus sp. RM1_1_31]|nr:DUF748 domain-containing protein [Hydrococcus sp. RM1_1_31]